MMRKRNIQAQEKGFFYRNSTILFRLVCFIFFVNLHCQIYVGESTRISVSGEAVHYTKDTIIPCESLQKESSKIYVHLGTIISGDLSNNISYISKPETKEKIRHKLFAATRKKKVEKPVEASSRPEHKKPMVSYVFVNRSSLSADTSKPDMVITPVGNYYKIIAIGLKEQKRKNIIHQSKDRISYTPFVSIVAACYIFYALRGPPLSYLKS